MNIRVMIIPEGDIKESHLTDTDVGNVDIADRVVDPIPSIMDKINSSADYY